MPQGGHRIFLPIFFLYSLLVFPNHSVSEVIHCHLDSFQSGFKPGNGTEIILVFPVDNRCQKMDRRQTSVLILLDLSMTFSTRNHGIFLGWNWKAPFCLDSGPAVVIQKVL